MRRARVICAVLLALPLIVFGGNHFVGLFELPMQELNAGTDLLQAMRDGGLMGAVAFSHVLFGALLLVPRTRFCGALLQLPITAGIVAFHATMLPQGLGMAIGMLVLNTVVLTDPVRLRELMARVRG